MTAAALPSRGDERLTRLTDPARRRLIGLAGPAPIYVDTRVHVDQEDDPEHPDRYFVALVEGYGDTGRAYLSGPALLDLAYRVLARLHPAAAELLAALTAAEATAAGQALADLGGPRTIDAVLTDLRAAAIPVIDPADPIQLAAARQYVTQLRDLADTLDGDDTKKGIRGAMRRRAALLETWTDPLRLHLASQHAAGFILNEPDIDPVEVHDHEHDGPGTIRNHGRGDLSYTIEAATTAVIEHRLAT